MYGTIKCMTLDKDVISTAEVIIHISNHVLVWFNISSLIAELELPRNL